MSASPQPRRYLLVTGSRGITDAARVSADLDAAMDGLGLSGEEDDVVLLHGGAAGVDTLAGEWARARGLPVRVVRPPRGALRVKYSFLERDRAMVAMATWVVSVWNGTSPGTRFTTECARKAGKLVRQFIYAPIK